MNKKIILLTLLFIISTISCVSTRTIKQDYKYYIIKGYISSRSDAVSLDITIFASPKDSFYKIEGYDTLLGKKRFLLILDREEWKIEDEGGISNLNYNDEVFKILPSPLIFNYKGFLEGKVPAFIDYEKIEQSKDKKVYYKNEYKQVIYFEEDKVKYFEIYRGEKRIFKFEYKGYIEVKNDSEYRIFPNTLYIYDYENKKRIDWWFDSINFIK